MLGKTLPGATYKYCLLHSDYAVQFVVFKMRLFPVASILNTSFFLTTLYKIAIVNSFEIAGFCTYNIEKSATTATPRTVTVAVRTASSRTAFRPCPCGA